MFPMPDLPVPNPRCPWCRNPDLEVAERPRCAGCGRTFLTLGGIPDLRVEDDVFRPNAEDQAIARALETASAEHSFAETLDLYYQITGEAEGERRRRQIAHIRTAPARARQWLDLLGACEGPILDLGCGPGGFLMAAASLRPESSIVGLDIALRWLVLALKRRDEAPADVRNRMTLLCANAESIPLPDNSIGGIVGGDVIEHVADPARVLAEAYRVLKPGGRLVLATPNRFSLTPEPHVGLWGVGFLPRPWMAPYVRLARKGDFRAIRTHSAHGWNRLLRESPFRGALIFAPDVPQGSWTSFTPVLRAGARLYHETLRWRLGRGLARTVGPLLHLVAEKPLVADRPARPSLRPTPRRRAS